MNQERDVCQMDYAPHGVDPTALERTQYAFEALLARRASSLREFRFRRGRLELREPVTPSESAMTDDEVAAVLERGFRPLLVSAEETLAGFRASSETWIDPTTTMKLEIIRSMESPLYDEESELEFGLGGDGTRYIVTTYFADGTSLILVHDGRFTETWAHGAREVVEGTQNLARDLDRFRGAVERRVSNGKRPLLCPDAQTYLMHDELHGRFLVAQKVAEFELHWLLLNHSAGFIAAGALALVSLWVSVSPWFIGGLVAIQLAKLLWALRPRRRHRTDH